MMRFLKKSGLKGWRRHYPLKGKPDFVWRKERVALFVDGCFWHGHDCDRNLTPRSNVRFWEDKISKNKARDHAVTEHLQDRGWKVIRVWECQLGDADALRIALVEALREGSPEMGITRVSPDPAT